MRFGGSFLFSQRSREEKMRWIDRQHHHIQKIARNQLIQLSILTVFFSLVLRRGRSTVAKLCGGVWLGESTISGQPKTNAKAEAEQATAGGGDDDDGVGLGQCDDGVARAREAARNRNQHGKRECPGTKRSQSTYSSRVSRNTKPANGGRRASLEDAQCHRDAQHRVRGW